DSSYVTTSAGRCTRGLNSGIAQAHHLAILDAVSPRLKKTPSQASVPHGTFSPRRARYPATRTPEIRKLPPRYVSNPGRRHSSESSRTSGLVVSPSTYPHTPGP